MPQPPTFYRPGTYQTEDSVTWLMRRITLLFAQDVAAQLGPAGLTHGQWVPLFKLYQGVATTAAELARECYLDAGSMTRTLDRLEAKGFVRRSRSERDRRVVNLALTAEGQAVAQRIPTVLCEVQNAHLTGFAQGELDTLKTLLRRVMDNAVAGQAERGGEGASK